MYIYKAQEFSFIIILPVAALTFKSSCVPFLVFFWSLINLSLYSSQTGLPLALSQSLGKSPGKKKHLFLMLKWLLEIFRLVKETLVPDVLMIFFSYFLTGHLFIQTFWQTMSREWNGIDNLRLDKYYMVILISSLVDLFWCKWWWCVGRQLCLHVHLCIL